MNTQTKANRKPSKAAPTTEQMVCFCVAAFHDYMIADATLQNAKAEWDAARYGLRTELARAYRVVAHGKAWDKFLAAVRGALVKAKVCKTTADAGRLIRNQLIALSITGKGSNGKRKKGGGRKEKTETGKATTLSEKDVANRLVKCLAYVAKAQEQHAGDEEVMELLGDIAAILGGK